MRAGWYERTGPAEQVTHVGEMATPTPLEGEVLVRLHASGVNPSDYKKRGNASASPEFPRIVPHSDGAGVVAGVGRGVTDYREGDRVWVFNAQWRRPFGTAAEMIALPENLVRPLPERTSFAEGACFGIPAMTGYRTVHQAGDVAGKIVYVPGATGRVGAYAVQFAKWRGAKVIASTASGKPSQDALLALGADVVLDRTSTDLETRILRETHQHGVDHIVEVDITGNIGFDERILAEGGSIVSFGAAAAPSLAIALAGRRARNMSLHFIFVYLLDEATQRTTCAGIIEAEAQGRLKHRIGGRFSLAELAAAHRAAETTASTGHIIVEM